MEQRQPGKSLGWQRGGKDAQGGFTQKQGEGRNSGLGCFWITATIIVHVLQENREFYNLERIWSDDDSFIKTVDDIKAEWGKEP